VELPQIPCPEPELFGDVLGLVPEQTVLERVGRGCVMDIEGGIIVGNLVHDTAKHGKIRDDPCIIFPQGLAIPQITFSQDKDPVHIRPDDRLNIHTILQGKDEPHFPMSTIFVKSLKKGLVKQLGIVGTIVQ